MNYDAFQSLVFFAEGHFEPTSEDNEERVGQLLDWIVSLETDPHTEDSPAAISLATAKQIAAYLR